MSLHYHIHIFKGFVGSSPPPLISSGLTVFDPLVESWPDQTPQRIDPVLDTPVTQDH